MLRRLWLEAFSRLADSIFFWRSGSTSVDDEERDATGSVSASAVARGRVMQPLVARLRWRERGWRSS